MIIWIRYFWNIVYNLFFIKYFVFSVNYVIKNSLGFMEINIVYIIKILVKYFYIKD